MHSNTATPPNRLRPRAASATSGTAAGSPPTGSGGRGAGPGAGGGSNGRGRGRDAPSDPWAWPRTGVSCCSGFTETSALGGARQTFQLGAVRGWFLSAYRVGLWSFQWRRMPSPPGVGAAGRMRSLSAAWLLGGAILLAASAPGSCTTPGEKLG